MDTNQMISMDVDSSKIIENKGEDIDQAVPMDTDEMIESNISLRKRLKLIECRNVYNVDGQHKDIQITYNVDSTKETVAIATNDTTQVDPNVCIANTDNADVKYFPGINVITSVISERNDDFGSNINCTVQQDTQETLTTANFPNVHADLVIKTEKILQKDMALDTSSGNMQMCKNVDTNQISLQDTYIKYEEPSTNAFANLNKVFSDNNEINNHSGEIYQATDYEDHEDDEDDCNYDESQNDMIEIVESKDFDDTYSNYNQGSCSSITNDASSIIEPYVDIESTCANSSVGSFQHHDIDSKENILDMSRGSDIDATTEGHISDSIVVEESVGNFDGRLLLITNRKQLENNTILIYKKGEQNTGNIQCGLCSRYFQSDDQWKRHLADHYGVGWKVGENRININDFNTVLQHVTAYYDSVESNSVKCRICRKVVRSPMGLLTHIRYCGTVYDSMACMYCNREYSKFSITSHQISCAKQHNSNEAANNIGKTKRTFDKRRENELNASTELTNQPEQNLVTNQCDSISRLIRYNPPFNVEEYVSDMTTEKVFCPKSHCNFIGSSIEDLKTHLADAGHTPIEGFVCVTCADEETFSTEKLAYAHITKYHQPDQEISYSIYCVSKRECDVDSNSQETSDNDAGESENIVKKAPLISRVGSSKRILRRVKKVYPPRSNNLEEDMRTRWFEFVNQNYSDTPLFNNQKMSTHTVIGSFADSELANICPKEKKSVKFTISNDCKSFKNLKKNSGSKVHLLQAGCIELNKFHLIRTKEDIFTFVGGAVLFIRWIPLPENVSEQYLLVCFENKNKLRRSECERKEIRTYSTSLLVYKLTPIKEDLPDIQLHYGFKIPNAPIYDADFLPSGGYKPESNRLGLVAVATASYTVSVYALPLKIDHIERGYSSNFYHVFIITSKPYFVLNLSLGEKKWKLSKKFLRGRTQCLQVCWSHAKNHNHIFASFACGYIGIWNVNDGINNVSRTVVNGIVNYVPLNYFYAGESFPNHLCIHYDSNGPRWLAVVVMYRNLLVYDIRDLTTPICILNELLRNMVRDMDWSPVWEPIAIGLCDSFLNYGKNFIAVNPLNVLFGQHKVESMACAVSQVHYSPHRNIYFCGADNGDVLILNIKELTRDRPLGKAFGDRRCLSTLQLRQIENDKVIGAKIKGFFIEDKISLDKDDYYLVFGPAFTLESSEKEIYEDSNNRCVPMPLIHMVRVTALRCNHNLLGKELVAVGYENGLLRIFSNSSFFLNNSKTKK